MVSASELKSMVGAAEMRSRRRSSHQGATNFEQPRRSTGGKVAGTAGFLSPRAEEKEEYRRIIDRNAGGVRTVTAPTRQEAYVPPLPPPGPAPRGGSERSDELFPTDMTARESEADEDDIAAFYAKSSVFSKAFAAASLGSLTGHPKDKVANEELKEALL